MLGVKQHSLLKCSTAMEAAGSNILEYPPIVRRAEDALDLEAEEEDFDRDVEEIDTDAVFIENFRAASMLTQHPSFLRTDTAMDTIVRGYLALIDIWVNTRLPSRRAMVRNFAAHLCPEPPFLLTHYSEPELENVFHEITYQWGVVDHYIDLVGVKEFNDGVEAVSGKPPEYYNPEEALSLIAELAHQARYILFFEQRYESLHSKRAMQLLPDKINYAKFSWRNNNALTPQQRVLLKLYRIIDENKYRKHETEIYREMATEEVQWRDPETGEEGVAGGHHTHAWESHMSIAEFVGSAISKKTDAQGWNDMTAGPSLEPIIKKLIALRDDDFPELEKDRHYFSFLDGIYHCTYDDFYAYDYETPQETKDLIAKQKKLREWVADVKRKKSISVNRAEIDEVKRQIDEIQGKTRNRGSDILPRNLVTANYFKYNFVPEEADDYADYVDYASRWDKCATPVLDRILDHQQFYDQHGEPMICNRFRCEERARYSVTMDTRPRWCEKHKTEEMIDKILLRCSRLQCLELATMWQTKEQAKLRGLERQKFCQEHAPPGCEAIPEAIRVGGSSLETDGLVDQFSVKNIFCALSGRLFYKIGEHDNFQVIPFLKGLASTGKSTIVKLIQSFYDPNDVQVLSNNHEGTFGLEPIMSKFLFVAPEIKENFGLPQAEFQSMVSGDPMSVARKFKQAKTVTWHVPGMLAGNTPPKWADKSGSISRRVVTFPFDCAVRIVDSTLDDELGKERPAIMRRCNLAYHSLVKYLEGQENKNLWSLMPQKLLRAKMDLQMIVSNLGYFVKENNEIVVDDSPDRMISFVPWDIFIEKLNNFNQRMHQRPPGHLDPKEHVEFFSGIGVDVVFDDNLKGRPRQRKWPFNNKRYKSPFLYGMTYKPADKEDEDDASGDESE